jgi:N-ethylmaleimide reductase
MAPMTRNRARPDGVASAAMATYYAQRASAALIITESTHVSPSGIGYSNTPGIYSDAQVAAWAGVADEVHLAGGRIFLQLFHAGRYSHRTLQPGKASPVAPSPIAPSGHAFTPDGPVAFEPPRELSRTEIAQVIDSFRSAATSARLARFDGVELHAASGYLIDQFLRGGSNHRSDLYGGSARNRVRFLVEVTEAVAAVWGASRIGVRLSPLSAVNSMFDANPEETFRTAVDSLNSLGLAYLHIVERVDDPAAGPPFDLGVLRRAWRGPFMVNSGYDFARAAQAVETGRADFVSFGRLFLANPDLPVRLALNAPLNEPDRRTFYSGGDRGYLDYPLLGAPR